MRKEGKKTILEYGDVLYLGKQTHTCLVRFDCFGTLAEGNIFINCFGKNPKIIEVMI